MKLPNIEANPSHFYGFPTATTIIRPTEIDPLIQALIAMSEWFELAPFPPDRWSLRVRQAVTPILTKLRADLP